MTIRKIDAYIVERARAGDHAAFEAIFEEYGQAVAGYLYRLLNDREIARDLSQETFLKVYRGLPRLQLNQNELEGSEFNLSAWIFTIAHHNAMDYLRRKQRNGRSLAAISLGWLGFGGQSGSNPGPQLTEGFEPSTADEAEQVVLGDTVGRALARLPKEQVACIILHYHQGFSYNEAAEILEVPLTTFKMRLYRARLAFQAAYTKEVEESKVLPGMEEPDYRGEQGLKLGTRSTGDIDE